MEQEFRKYGKPPFNVAVLHGGPGAPGGMASVARELSTDFGIIEPLQTGTSLKKQLNELLSTLKNNTSIPVNLIGWSWGAMLGYLFAAQYPEIVKKLILLSSAVFEEGYSSKIMQTRSIRLNKADREKVRSLLEKMNDTSIKDKDSLLTQLARSLYKADSYNPLSFEDEILEYNYRVFKKVWDDAEDLRKTGELVELGKNINCPVVAIHGDYDPHPATGIKEPLSGILKKDFRFIELDKCGHYPWLEKEAKDEFYKILKEELK